MLTILHKIFGFSSLNKLKSEVETINRWEPEIEKLSAAELEARSLDLKKRVEEGESLDAILVEAFALVREAAKRTLGQRPFDEQLMGGIVLHRRGIAEMMTGEGKTLAAVAPAYLNALSGKGVHVVTVNEYLARRDTVWMGQIYRALGLSVACLVPNGAYLYDPAYVGERGITAGEELDRVRDERGSYLVQQDFLRPISRREAYLADVTYGTNHEFGFDYLRDNLAYRPEEIVQRGHHYAIIDEVDSILIDEARTPLIIAVPDTQASDFYKVFARIVSGLVEGEDYIVDEKHRSAAITASGIEKVEKMIGVPNLYAPEHLRLAHFLEESLRAKAIFKRDKDYVVKNGEVIIVDEFTGRLLYGRRYQGGLHQALEAKEGVGIKEESRIYAKISIQNYFRMYEKLAGMTGTAQTSAEEFYKVYGLEVVSIPTHRPMIREDRPDVIYKNQAAKWRAVVKEIKECYERGRPVLVGTTSIQKNEIVSALLSEAGVPHEVLNAKNNEREATIIAQAGKLKAVTVATNMAGRGVDIMLGGPRPSKFKNQNSEAKVGGGDLELSEEYKKWEEEYRKVVELGGLHVIGTERHEARRIDNQLRGRAGRQGDPGSSQFFLALDDDLLRIFGGERIKNLMERFDLPEDQPLRFGFLSQAVAQAQAKVEGANFDLRKHLLEYDDVLNRQRTAVYKRRREIMFAPKEGKLANIIFEAAAAFAEKLFSTENEETGKVPEEEIRKAFADAGLLDKDSPPPATIEEARALLSKRSVEVSAHSMASFQLLSALDFLWMNHLEDLEALSESVGLRAYGQKDPLVEYREDARRLFAGFWDNFNALVFSNVFKLKEEKTVSGGQGVTSGLPVGVSKVGRNDPCPCGAKYPDGRPKKYKKCHGK
jgi:preprotein translocase subunit SecA